MIKRKRSARPCPAISGSPPGKLAVYDWKKIGKGAALAVVGGASAGLASWLASQQGQIDQSTIVGALAATIVPVLVNLLRKLVADTRVITGVEQRDPRL